MTNSAPEGGGSCGCLSIDAPIGGIYGLANIDSMDTGPWLYIMMLLVGITGLVILGWSKRHGWVAASPPNLPAYTGGAALEFDVALEQQTIEGQTLPLLVFKTRGILSTTQSMIRPCFEVRISDVTKGADSESQRVLTMIGRHQEVHSTEFRYQSIFGDPLPPGAGPTDWASLGATPLEALVFPSSGDRVLRLDFSLLDVAGGSKTPVNSATCNWLHTVERGYLDFEAEESEAQSACLQLAMVMAASDGQVDDVEVEVIKEWAEKSVASLDSSRAAERRSTLNRALKEATSLLRAGRTTDLESGAIAKLRSNGARRSMYDAYELCLQVLSADGEAHPGEMAKLTTMADKLDLDEAKVRMLTDQHTADVKFAPVEGANAEDQILGITPDMSTEEIRRHLNKLYNKHEARVGLGHSDPEKAARAKEWVDLIASARVRHIE